MTISPDVPGFADVDVTGLDHADPADLTDLAMDRAAVLMPQWEPKETHQATLLVESLAEITAAYIAAVSPVPGRAMEQALSLAGLVRDAGTAASGTVTVSVVDTLGHTIPAGTRIVLGNPQAANALYGELDEEIVVDTGDTTATGTFVLDDVGAVTGLSTSTPVLLVDAATYVDTITISAITSPGTNPDTDAQYLARGSAYQVSRTLGIPPVAQFEARALADPRVGRARGVQRWDGTGTADGTDVGHMTDLVLGITGAPLSGGVMTDIESGLQASTSGDLTVHVKAMTRTLVDVTATFTLKPGNVTATVQAAIAAALTAYLSPLNWVIGEPVVLSRLLQVIETTTGVLTADITVPADDVEIGPNDVVRPGTLTITLDA